jgi:hypothetical protein
MWVGLVELSRGTLHRFLKTARLPELCLIQVSIETIHTGLSMALQPFVGPWPLLQFRNLLYTVGRTPWTEDQPATRPLPTHRTTQTQNKRRHSYLEWDSNQRSQCSSGRRRFMPYTARPLWSAIYVYKKGLCNQQVLTNHIRRWQYWKVCCPPVMKRSSA